MNWLTLGFISNMYGPHFLLLYGVVILVTLVTCWSLLRNQAESVASKNEPTGWWIKAVGALVIAGLGGYKLVVALAKGRHNVLFLILMGIGSLCILLAMSPGPPRDAEE